ncbi:MAG: hemolysin family protein [Syntrophomonadaceae bacterium]|nr:hemolysin family protein [Syntrophomonadaceae bacterium]
MLTSIMFLIILVLLNAFFAASEIALISLNDNKIRALAEKGDKKALAVKKLLDEPSRFLATIQIGITLAGFLASAFASESFASRIVHLAKLSGIALPETWLKTIAMILITIILSYFTLVLGELVPKRLAMKKAEPIAYTAVGVLNVLSSVTSPFVKLLTLSTNVVVKLLGFDPYEEDEEVTEEEIRMMVDIGEEKGAIHETEKVMINNIFEFNNKTVGQIMTHRIDMSALPVEADLKAVIAFVNTEKYSRIPVYQYSLDNIIGVLYAKDLIAILSDHKKQDGFTLSQIIRPPYFVAESKPTDELFREMQRNNTHIAIIIDEHGGTAGMVTIEDLIEEIVGNIFDEYDEEEHDFEEMDENTVMINGGVDLDEVEDYLQVELPTDEYETLSGFLIGHLGRIPDENDKPSIEYNGLVFQVEEVEEKRVSLVKVRRKLATPAL